MAKPKKFGTFGGVFTPSILTILGVILFLRFPQIVGQAGLFETLGIILIAHIISATTGLSVASIATDKKVQAGGTYYMISRSLGLPIGGTLGLALFVGLSLSVSLYLIGFAESFLAYLELPVGKFTIRLTGSIALVTVTTITFISTSLAIRSQYLILTAIGLSLLSILFGSHDYAPEKPLLQPVGDAAPFMILFGIFFPAVTGFEAGVSLSGDLKNPKKSLPAGTIAAIGVGLFAYIGLAFFFTYTVNSRLLASDPNALFKISLVPELVIAGIWGATLSSALGSILGAPRILQATAKDQITPRLFARGTGLANEPRNALLLCFIIAEAGILIGDLNVIAGVVSMFFITTYGFLNLSCAIESWANADFRPEFKIPRLVSITGAVACFLVMIQLNIVAFLAATLILGLLFLFLKRKELTLAGGDTWGGFWSSVVRTGLQRLSRRSPDSLNWRPNIILFSGGQARPYLVDMGRVMVGQFGMLSNFELIASPDHAGIISRAEQGGAREPEPSVFTQRFFTRNIFEGIDLITSVYGFSGVEPNTILMGWSRNTRDPDRFASLIRQFRAKNYNMAFLSYDKEKGFGRQQTIDIWWNGKDNNLTYALSLVRFITTHHSWRSSSVRLLTVVNQPILVDKAYRNIEQLLENYRLTARILVINNNVKQEDEQDIIRHESQQADLVIMGMSSAFYQQPEKQIARVNHLTQTLGSTLLLGASSFFDGFQLSERRPVQEEKERSGEKLELVPLFPSQNDVITVTAQRLDQKVQDINTLFVHKTLKPLEQDQLALLAQIKQLTQSSMTALQKQVKATDSIRAERAITKAHNDVLFQIRRILQEYRAKELESMRNTLQHGIEQHHKELRRLVDQLSNGFYLTYNASALQPTEGESFSVKWLKRYYRLAHRITGKPVTLRVRYQELARYYVEAQGIQSLNNLLQRLNNRQQKNQNQLREIILQVNDSYEKFRKSEQHSVVINDIQQELNDDFSALERKIKNQYLRHEYYAKDRGRQQIQYLSNLMERIQVNRIINRQEKVKQHILKTSQPANLNFPDSWYHSTTALVNTLYLDVAIVLIKNRIKVNLQRLHNELKSEVDGFIIRELERSIQQTENAGKAWQQLAEKAAARKNGENDPASGTQETETDRLKLSPLAEHLLHLEEMMADTHNDVQRAWNELPEELEILNTPVEDKKRKSGASREGPTTVALRRVVEYNLETNLLGPFYQKMEEIQKALGELQYSTRDLISITNFNLDNIEQDASIPAVLSETRNKLENKKQRVEELLAEFAQGMEQELQHAFEPLNAYAILRTSGNLKQQVREQSSKKAFHQVIALNNRINAGFNRFFTQLVYTKSETRLFTDRIDDHNQENHAAEVIDYVLDQSPDPEVVRWLPAYYKNLFSGKSNIGDDYWLNREEEIRMGHEASKRHRAGQQGALMITGIPQSGKTALSRQIASGNYATEHVFFVYPPDEGTAETGNFYEAFKHAFRKTGSPDEILSAIETPCAVIIDEVELWWERSEHGFDVLDEIFRLIIMYSEKCFFIINANVQSFTFMNRQQSLGDYFHKVIYCKPLDANVLKEIIMRRHQSSGLTFRLNGVPENELRAWRIARLFNRFFDYSQGNIGIALRAWINHIRKVSGDEIQLVAPKPTDFDFLQYLVADDIVYLNHFLLHRRSSLNRLCRMMEKDQRTVARTLNRLVRLGLLQRNVENIYFINPNIIFQLINSFKTNELL